MIGSVSGGGRSPSGRVVKGWYNVNVDCEIKPLLPLEPRFDAPSGGRETFSRKFLAQRVFPLFQIFPRNISK